jgi:hypothetical protein
MNILVKGTAVEVYDDNGKKVELSGVFGIDIKLRTLHRAEATFHVEASNVSVFDAVFNKSVITGI